MTATGSVLCFKTEGLVVGGKRARKENRQLGQVGWSRQAAERVEDSLLFPVWSKDWLFSPLYQMAQQVQCWEPKAAQSWGLGRTVLGLSGTVTVSTPGYFIRLDHAVLSRV